ncbi:MAG: efflux RND transporter periplasmic adaptor subunit [Snowella sp.]|nr:efflux RND transporter periplasmic adaptor subunit [Snowella sp.]
MIKFDYFPPILSLYRLWVAVLVFILATPNAVLSHGGHSHEFEGGDATTVTPNAIQVDQETIQRLGIRIEPVTRKNLNISLKTTGKIETLPSKQVEVTTPIEGAKVLELLVEPGDRVTAGQAVAVLYSPQLVELRVDSQEKRAEAEGALQDAQADLTLARQNYQKFSQIANAEIRQARSQLAFFQEKYARDKELAEAGALPRRNALESETQYKEAQTNLTKVSTRREVIDAEAQVKRAEAAVKLAKTRLQLSNSLYQTRLAQLEARPDARGLVTVTAPIAGRVADREVTLGQSFQDAGGKLMTIINDSRVYATANIYEKDLAKVKSGQSIRLKVASVGDRRFVGRITTIGSLVEEGSRVVPVRAAIENANGVLKPGMFAELEILTGQTTSTVLAIPQTAVIEANGQQRVYVKNGDAFQPVEVTLGESFGDFVEIKTGLFEGDEIVTRRAPQLYAQSLRGGSPDPSTVEQAQETPTENPQASPFNRLLSLNEQNPWLLMGMATLVIGVGAFAAGTSWGNRRNRADGVNPKPTQSVSPNFIQPTEININPQRK